jgi:hypothetical protein
MSICLSVESSGSILLKGYIRGPDIPIGVTEQRSFVSKRRRETKNIAPINFLPVAYRLLPFFRKTNRSLKGFETGGAI